MFGDREARRRRLQMLVERFRERGATSPEKAMTAEDLGLPPQFAEAMHRRLGQLGIFVEVNGKYYLNEERLKQVREQRAKAAPGSQEGSGGGRAGGSSWFRVVGVLLMLPIGIIVALILFYFAVSGGVFFPGEILVILLVVLVVVTAARLFFWRSRRRYWSGQ